MPAQRRPRVLIVNAYIDETRRLAGRPHFVPQAVGPAYLAGAFARERVDVRVHSELYGGPLLERAAFEWPDLVVLTGMTSAYDRMRHIAAYVRASNPRAVIVAGGQAIRALPHHGRRFFDHCCLGDVEELQDVAREVLGPEYAAELLEPRFDLIKDWMGFIGYVESSRNCNFKCAFCTLTGEGNAYTAYDLEHVRRQIEAVGYRTCLLFVDNNFYGNDRSFFLARMELLRDLKKRRAFGGWAALVTQDFFARPENLALAREAGCLALFSGVESFDALALKRYHKLQNLVLPQVETIKSCLDAGIVFQYGVIFDTSTRSLAEIDAELAFITGTPEITLPAFVNLAIPILRTPYFYECLADGRFLPHTKLRDMDGNTVVVRPLDPLPDVVRFLDGMPTLRGHRARVARHAIGFWKRYHRKISIPQMVSAVGNSALLCLPALAHNHSGLWRRSGDGVQRTYVTTTEPVGPLYEPAFALPEHLRDHFRPTMITDADGRLVDDVAEDLASPPPARPIAVPLAVGRPRPATAQAAMAARAVATREGDALATAP